MNKAAKFFHKYKLCLITYTIVAIISVTLNVITVALCCTMAYAERGYGAIGGEWILAGVLSYAEWRWAIHTAKSRWEAARVITPSYRAKMGGGQHR